MAKGEIERLIAALDLPAGSRVDQRVAKKLLVEHGAPTAADKRYIQEGIEELTWLAALKPATIGVPEYRDTNREYLEIAILGLTLRAGAKAARLVELVHRAVPYPLLVLTSQGARLGLSAAHKRWAQNEAGKTVLDGAVIVADLDDGACESEFYGALALGRQSRITLYSLYQGWIDTLLAFRAAHLTGRFKPAITTQQAAARYEALCEWDRLTAEMARLRAAAVKEKQTPRLVELNLELKRLEARLETLKTQL